MKNCRKMLGDITDETLIELMNLIETQNRKTLALWALSQVEKECFVVYEKSHEASLKRLAEKVKESIEDENISEIKNCVKQAKSYIVKEDFLEEIATRAIVCAMGVMTTPTNALGYTFYVVALRVYLEVGLDESREVYDEKAHLEYEKILDSLKDVSVQDEKNPVKVKWKC